MQSSSVNNLSLEEQEAFNKLKNKSLHNGEALVIQHNQDCENKSKHSKKSPVV